MCDHKGASPEILCFQKPATEVSLTQHGGDGGGEPLHDWRGEIRRAEQAIPGGADKAGKVAGLGHSRYFRQDSQPVRSGHGQSPGLPLSDGAQRRSDLVEEDIHISRQQRRLCAGLPTIGDMSNINPGGNRELSAGQMGGGAIARGGVVQPTGIGARRNQQRGAIRELRAALNADGERIRHISQMGDGCEIANHIEGQRAVK